VQLTTRDVVERVAWTALVAGIAYFFLRDVPHYAIYTPESYGEYWATRGYLIPHLVGAGVGILVGLLQFSSRTRRRWPRFHRRLGWAYVLGCIIGAPGALGLAATSGCVACRPALASLTIYWLAATLFAFVLARRKDFARHQQFMIRSFVAMNAFVIIRLSDMLPDPGLGDHEFRIVREYMSCFVPLVLTEVWLSWRAAAKASMRSTARA
jgi:uncharacterized membrane protein YfcA